MLDWGLTPSALANGGSVFLLALVFLAVLRGELVPKRRHDEQIADKDAQIKSWREAYNLERESSKAKDKALSDAVDALGVTSNVLRHLRRASGMPEDPADV